MVSVRFTGKDEAEVSEFAAAAAACAAAHPDAAKVGRLGPAPMAIARVRQKFRYHLLLRSGDVRALRAVTQGLLEWESGRKSPLRMEVDVDPVETL
jgi:primosomal protein N' (replication factor Y)